MQRLLRRTGETITGGTPQAESRLNRHVAARAVGCGRCEPPHDRARSSGTFRQ
jgi:hypothetical protein